MATTAGRIGRIVKRSVVILAGLLVVLLVVGFFVVRAVIEPRWDEFGTVEDEAKKAGLTREGIYDAVHTHFADYFVGMDKGLLQKPEGTAPYPPEVRQIAEVAKLPPEEVRKSAIRGQNMWLVWTGGNDRFWDYATANTAGAFDLLKTLSSHPSMAYGRHNRWRWLGLVNEPCFTEATAPDENRYGLWLDQRDPNCPADPFADADAFPGAKVGARGSTVPVGSIYGEPSGIIGLRLFPNPDFDEAAKKRWDPERYYTDPSYYNDAKLVRPYRVGMACSFCHVGPDPLNPPHDPENPHWENLTSNPGAQYYWVNRIFFWNTAPRTAAGQPAPNEGSLLYQLFHTNPPGTLDTSLVSTDYMNNPRSMNAVYSVLARLGPSLRWGEEQLASGEMDNKQFQDYPETAALSQFWNPQSGDVHTMRVLKDGADSVGALGALNRVYLNIGLFSEEWLLHFRPFLGGRKITPIKISDAEKNSVYWQATEDQTADMAVFFLVAARPDHLADAPGGKSYQEPFDSPLVTRGKMVFAENCAACHSSKIPPAPANSGIDDGICAGGGNGPNYRACWDRYWNWTQTRAFKDEMTKLVFARDERGRETFLDSNYLSTERRVPVDLLQTNACTPLATNGLEGDIWDEFTSQSYKSLPPVKELTVYHPISGGAMPLQPLGNGRGYLRPASLISLWSSAPYLSNNSVGFDEYAYARSGTRRPYAAMEGVTATAVPAGYERDRCPAASDADPDLPCVANRMRLFDRSIRQMLNPETRATDRFTEAPVPGTIYRTTAPACFVFPHGYLPESIQGLTGVLHRLAGWAFDKDGNMTLGPLPANFPINALINTKLLPDNDEPDMLGHLWKLVTATPVLLDAFSQLGGACTPQQLADPETQVRAEQVVKETGLIDTLVSLSKCPDYVVNRGHSFGADLPAADKEALIAYLKYF